jgi:hypothetical protein
MKLYEMMDKTPVPSQTGTKTYLSYMAVHRPDYFTELCGFLRGVLKTDQIQEYLNALNLGADMALTQVLKHGIPEDLAEVYGNTSKLHLPGSF